MARVDSLGDLLAGSGFLEGACLGEAGLLRVADLFALDFLGAVFRDPAFVDFLFLASVRLGSLLRELLDLDLLLRLLLVAMAACPKDVDGRTVARPP